MVHVHRIYPTYNCAAFADGTRSQGSPRCRCFLCLRPPLASFLSRTWSSRPGPSSPHSVTPLSPLFGLALGLWRTRWRGLMHAVALEVLAHFEKDALANAQHAPVEVPKGEEGDHDGDTKTEWVSLRYGQRTHTTSLRMRSSSPAFSSVTTTPTYTAMSCLGSDRRSAEMKRGYCLSAMHRSVAIQQAYVQAADRKDDLRG